MAWLGQWYDWIRALHVISVVSWMAGMLTLPWLFAYHCRAGATGAAAALFVTMERQTMRLVINPAMMAACTFGVLMALIPGLIDWQAGWVWVKIVLLVLLTSVHGFLSRWRRQFAENTNTKRETFYRGVGWSQVAMAAGIIVMVVARPF